MTGCLAELLAQSFASESEAAEQKSYVTYSAPTDNLDAPSVTLFEARSLLASSGTTGFRTWEAALFLGSYLYSSEGQNLVRGKSVIELGAGTGFLSILCARHLGARYVLATDGSGEVVTDLQTNLSLNGLDSGKSMDTVTFSWGHTLVGGVLDIKQDTSTYDVVLGADVVSYKSSTNFYCFRSSPLAMKLSAGYDYFQDILESPNLISRYLCDEPRLPRCMHANFNKRPTMLAQSHPLLQLSAIFLIAILASRLSFPLQYEMNRPWMYSQELAVCLRNATSSCLLCSRCLLLQMSTNSILSAMMYHFPNVKINLVSSSLHLLLYIYSRSGGQKT